MLPVFLHTDDANVSGYVGISDLHRSNRNDISVSADGHRVQDRDLAHAIEQGYCNYLPMVFRPNAVIRLYFAKVYVPMTPGRLRGSSFL